MQNYTGINGASTGAAKAFQKKKKKGGIIRFLLKA